MTARKKKPRAEAVIGGTVAQRRAAVIATLKRQHAEEREEIIKQLRESERKRSAEVTRLAADHDRLARQAFLTAGRLARLADDLGADGARHLSHLAAMIKLELVNVAEATRPAHWPGVARGETAAAGAGGIVVNVSDFHRHCLSNDDGAWTSHDEVYDAYVEWCARHGGSPLNAAFFREGMRAHYIEKPGPQPGTIIRGYGVRIVPEAVKAA